MLAERWKREHDVVWSSLHRSLYDAGVLLVSIIFLVAMAVLLLAQI
jgi:hypothetical protein